MADPFAGYTQLGHALGGGGALPAAYAEAQGEQLGANTQSAIAQAQGRIQENQAKAQLEDKLKGDPTFAQHAAAIAGVLNAGGKYEDVSKGVDTNAITGGRTTIQQPDTPENHAARVAAAQSIDPQSLGNALNPNNAAHIDAQTNELIPAQAEAQRAAATHSIAGAHLQDVEAANNPHVGAVVDANGNPKAPAGFQWALNPDGTPVLDANGRQTQVPISGGAKDPNAPAAMGSRESAIFQRALNAGALGTKAIANVARGSMGQSGGIAGIGASPGHSVLQSTVDSLRNKLSPEEVQQYMVMNTGLARNLAAVESSGMVSPGTFSDQIGQGTTLRAGDTENTKLTRLAETRQILETGFNTMLSNPRVPESQKAYIRDHIAEVQQAIPFSVEDVQALNKAPAGTSLQDLITSKGLRKGGGAGALSDDDLVKRYANPKP